LHRNTIIIISSSEGVIEGQLKTSLLMKEIIKIYEYVGEEET